MKNNSTILFICILSVWLFPSCKVEPEAIHYGQDQCNFCKMNIVDKAHAAQNVSVKGKQFKYDAIECLIRDLNKKEASQIAINRVADYGNPGEMIDAVNAHFIISPGIKSPMGANLSALSNKDKAKDLIAEHGGDLFDWTGVQNRILAKE